MIIIIIIIIITMNCTEVSFIGSPLRFFFWSFLVLGVYFYEFFGSFDRYIQLGTVQNYSHDDR